MQSRLFSDDFDDEIGLTDDVFGCGEEERDEKQAQVDDQHLENQNELFELRHGKTWLNYFESTWLKYVMKKRG